jgi:hypothetical protein
MKLDRTDESPKLLEPVFALVEIQRHVFLPSSAVDNNRKLLNSCASQITSQGTLISGNTTPHPADFSRKTEVMEGIPRPVIRSFAMRGGRLWMWTSFQKLLEYMFSDFASLTLIVFESESRLQGVDAFAFSQTGVKSIILPVSVVVLCRG